MRAVTDSRCCHLYVCMPRELKRHARNSEDCIDSCSMLRGYTGCFVGKSHLAADKASSASRAVRAQYLIIRVYSSKGLTRGNVL